MTMMNNERTKKNKDNNSMTSQEKARLWNVFETEVIDSNKPNDPLECLYRIAGNRENCEMCQYSLSYSFLKLLKSIVKI